MPAGGIQAMESGPHRRREKRLERAGGVHVVTGPREGHCSHPGVGMGERQNGHREKFRQSPVSGCGAR